LPNSSRAAATVDDSGFHSDTARSQPGISSGETNVFANIVSGNRNIHDACAASGFTSKPR